MYANTAIAMMKSAVMDKFYPAVPKGVPIGD